MGISTHNDLSSQINEGGSNVPKVTLTKDQLAVYNEHPFSCPRCRSVDMEYGDIENEEPDLTSNEPVKVLQSMSCDECGLKWVDTYNLARMDESKITEDKDIADEWREQEQE